MLNDTIVVIADDLTGACEVAALGLRNGLKATVSTDLQPPLEKVDMLVIDTETRLDSPAMAAARLRSALDHIGPALPKGRLFKKIDSVLRGPLRAELDLLAENLGFERVVVAAGNPALGRTITGGYYRINGTPLHETDFAHDLHHPASSSWVMDLLGPGRFLGAHRCGTQEAVPEKGMVVVDVEAISDYRAWSHHLSEKTLPAGSAAFFEAVLPRWIQGRTSPPPTRPVPDAPLLLISGTTAAQQVNQLDRLAGKLPGLFPASLDLLVENREALLKQIKEALASHGRALLYMQDAPHAQPENAFQVRLALGDIARRLVLENAVRHLVVEGGATAASVAIGMQWRSFKACREWAQGIVTLQPETTGEPIFFTMKPGSYPWPESFAPFIFCPPAQTTFLNNA